MFITEGSLITTASPAIRTFLVRSLVPISLFLTKEVERVPAIRTWGCLSFSAADEDDDRLVPLPRDRRYSDTLETPIDGLALRAFTSPVYVR